MLRVLLTNDDGIGEPGLLALARALAPHCEVLVIAPEAASSGSSHSITLREPLYLTPQPGFAQLAGVQALKLRAYSCSGKPSDCVMLAHFVVAGGRQPHLVVSGINRGCNVAEDMTYSGTIGAALEGAVLGIPSLALSLDTERGGDFDEAAAQASLVLALLVYGHSFAWQAATLQTLRDTTENIYHSQDEHFWPLVPAPDSAAKHFPEPAAHWYPQLTAHAPCFNINLPGVSLAQVGGIRWSLGGVRKYADAISSGFDPQGRQCYYIGGDKVLQDDDRPGTDTHALRHAYISVTPITYDLSNRHEAALFREHLAQRMAEGLAQAPEAERQGRN